MVLSFLIYPDDQKYAKIILEWNSRRFSSKNEKNIL